MSIEDYECNFLNSHDDVACQALKAYDRNCDYPDSSLKPARLRKSLSYFAELYGRTTQELKEHWRCIER